MPTGASLPIIRGLVTHTDDAADPHLPLLIWWALEADCSRDPQAVLRQFQDPEIWSLPIVREHLLARLMRRFAQPARQTDWLVCARLLAAAPTSEDARRLMQGFEEGSQGTSLAALPPELVAAIARSGSASLALRLRQGEPAAIDEAWRRVADEQSPAEQRRQLIAIVGELQTVGAPPRLLHLVRSSPNTSVREAALSALQSFADADIATTLVGLHAQLPSELRAAAQSLLAARLHWTRTLLDAVEAGTIPAEQVPATAVRKILLHRDAGVEARVRRVWGDVQGATTAEMQQEIARYDAWIRSGSGNPFQGKTVFAAQCGKCHRLFEEGGDIGPDLTRYQRDDLRRMLLQVVNPNQEIREGYEHFVVQTRDGRTLTGLMTDQDERVVVLRTVDGQSHIVAREAVEAIQAVPLSLMPEGQLRMLGPQQVRDLFAYLRATQPLN